MAKKSFSENTPAEMFITQPTATRHKSGTVTPPPGFRVDYGIIETKSRRVQLLMQPSLYEKLKALAENQGMSVNNFIHQLLESAINEE